MVKLARVTKRNTEKFIELMMIFVGISGFFSVLFGAWLAHGGQDLAVKIQANLSIALQYQFLHTLALLACVLMSKKIPPSKLIISACIGFFLGIVCFSGTIYIKSFFDIDFLGKLTPLGGLLFAFSWLMLVFEGKNNL